MSAEINDQDELVSQFLAITGISDVDRATTFLEMSGGSLDNAIALFFENTGGGGGGSGPAGDGATAAAAMAEDTIRAPDETRSMRLMDSPMHAHPLMGHMMGMMQEQEEEDNMMMMSSAFGVSAAPMPFGGGAGSVREAINQHAAVVAAASMARGGSNSSRRSMGDEGDEDDYEYVDDDDDEDGNGEEGKLGDTEDKATPTLSDMFAPPSHLIHTAGGFQGARSVAKDSRRWLLVNIQRDSEFSSHALNRDVWRHDLVENLVREGFIFWQTMDTTAEGRTYVERYQVADFPHVAILDPRTGRLIWRKEGWTQVNPLTAMDFAEHAMDFCSRHSFDKPPVAARVRSNSVGKKRPMTEEEQLQEAMRASLQKTDGADDMDEDDSEVQYVGSSAEDSKEAAKSEEEKSDQVKASVVDEWLAVDVGEEPAEGALLQFRMPDSKKLQRMFALDNTVKTIYAFVAQSNEEAKGGREFYLKAGFPPKDLIDKIDDTIGSCGLDKQAVTVRWKD